MRRAAFRPGKAPASGRLPVRSKSFGGVLACSLEMIALSHCGTSGMISWIGLGWSSTTRSVRRPTSPRETVAGPLHITYSTLPRLNRSLRWSIVSPQRLLGRHVQRRACNQAALRQAGVIGRAGQAEIRDFDVNLVVSTGVPPVIVLPQARRLCYLPAGRCRA